MYVIIITIQTKLRLNSNVIYFKIWFKLLYKIWHRFLKYNIIQNNVKKIGKSKLWIIKNLSRLAQLL